MRIGYPPPPRASIENRSHLVWARELWRLFLVILNSLLLLPAILIGTVLSLSWWLLSLVVRL